jgi:RNA polymerase sigma-70 factor, ECF subfamily
MAAEWPNLELASEEPNQDFERLAEPLRREIKLHCYQMLGSLHEAEDHVQETYLRAWRSFSSFEADSSDERGSMRAWLYRIATNVCLNALESRKSSQRFLPDQLGPSTREFPVGAPATDVPWIEPYPDSNLEGIADYAPNPEARYTSREAVQLAFVAAIQGLPPRQRAAIMLCDVLGWAAAEAGTLLGGSTASINSALQRARDTLARRYPEGRKPVANQPTPAQQELLGRYLVAWESHDPDQFAALLKEDATVTMPPWLQWFVGRDAIRSFFAMAWKTCEGLRLVPVSANGQPGFAVYEFSAAEGRWNAHSIHVLTLESAAVSELTLFLEPSLFPAFGIPLNLPVDTNAGLHPQRTALEGQ